MRDYRNTGDKILLKINIGGIVKDEVRTEVIALD